MILRRKVKAQGLFLCLAALLVAIFFSQAFALDKRESRGLSHYIMGLMYDKRGDSDNAAKEYIKALQSDYKNPIIHFKLASVYIDQNAVDKAIEELKVASKLDPEAVEPHAVLSVLYATIDKTDESNREYELALKNASKIQPENINIYKSLGSLYLAQKNYKAAQETYKLIIKLKPEDAEAHFYLATLYDELKDRKGAIGELKTALQLNPDYSDALNYLGYLYVEEEKNFDQAEAMIKQALEFEPDNAAYIDSLGWLYFKKGRINEAISELERAASLLDDPVIYSHLGDAYMKKQDKEKARLSWQKSLQLSPEQEDVKEKLQALMENEAKNRTP